MQVHASAPCSAQLGSSVQRVTLRRVAASRLVQVQRPRSQPITASQAGVVSFVVGEAVGMLIVAPTMPAIYLAQLAADRRSWPEVVHAHAAFWQWLLMPAMAMLQQEETALQGKVAALRARCQVAEEQLKASGVGADAGR